MNEKMKCGHKVYDYFLRKIGEIVYIQWRCTNGCRSEWGLVGEVPHFDELKIQR